MKKQLLFFVIVINMSVVAQTGIGTTTPVNKFQVETILADPANSGTTANGNLRLSGTTGSHVLDFGLSSTSTYSWLQARSKSAYGTTYSLLLNPIGGNIGIGTNAPSSTLTIGNATGSIAGELTLNPAFTSNEGGQINLKKSLNGSTADWVIDQYGTSASDARFRIFNSLSESNGIVIKENGNVGIGILNPTVKLHVNGDIIANSISGTSDVRFKTNIRPVTNALDKIKALRGVYFNWKQEAFPQKGFGSQDELGFIAQEVETVVPEVVSKEKSEDEYRSVKYDKLVALLVEAMKEQQKQIDELKAEIVQLKKNKK